MRVESYTYKGFDYSVEFAVGSDWRTEQHKFYAQGGIFNTGYRDTFNAVVHEMENLIDTFLMGIPDDTAGLVEKLSELLVWEGYEECELDANAATILIDNFMAAQKAKWGKG